jgi:two-component system, NarL family, nitrate/nitrite response regulator NarL
VGFAMGLPDSSAVIRVLAADSTRMSSQLLATALERDKHFQVLDYPADGQEILSVVMSERPAVVILSAEVDGNPRKGFDLAREIHSRRPEIQVVMLLDSSEREAVLEAFRAGASGVFSRNESLKSLAKCICCVSQGQVWANSRELRYLLEALGGALPMRVLDAKGRELLSRREQEVVGCVAEGLSNREVAQRLGLTEHTVKNYLFRIFDKLGVSKRVEVALYAYHLGGTSELPTVPNRRNGKPRPSAMPQAGSPSRLSTTKVSSSQL